MEANVMYNPWDVAYEKWSHVFTREEIDDMLLCEIEELLSEDEDDEY